MISRATRAALAAAAALGGCNLAPAYAPPEIALPAAYTETGPWQPAQPADTAPRGPWWEMLGDSELNRLEGLIDAANPDLSASVARFDRARAYAAEAGAGLEPRVDLGGALSNNKQSIHRPLRSKQQPNYYGANTLGALASFEVDVWGRVRDLVAAGQATAQASAAEVAAVRLSLHADLADRYVQLRGLDDEIALLRGTVAAYASALDLVRARYRGNIASGVDLAQAEAQLATAKAQISDVSARRALLEHAIASLIGQPAPAFALPPAAAQMTLPEIPAGLPSTLLQRRPDIAEAERHVAAANQSIGVARAAFYPAFTLGFGGGFQDTGLNLVSLPESFWSLGPSVSLPLFNGGLLSARLAAAKAEFAEAAAKYRAVVLDAMQDIEDNLALLHWLHQESDDEDAAAAAARRARDLALVLYRDGAESYLEVVTAQTAALTAERATLALRTKRLQASVAMVRALGGGWSTRDLPAPDKL